MKHGQYHPGGSRLELSPTEGLARLRSLICSRRCAIRRRHRGLGLVELLIALSIAATLLAATAVAVDASSRAYRANQEQALLMQRCRLAMNRILAEIRTSSDHSPFTDTLQSSFTAGAGVIDDGIQMYEPDGTFHAYRLDAETNRLLVQRDDQWHTLLEGVDAFAVTMQPARSATSIKTGGGYDLLRCASVMLTVRTSAQTSLSSETTGRQTVTLSGSAVPRRTLQYR